MRTFWMWEGPRPGPTHITRAMAIQELRIKNMVCERCVLAVRTALEGLGYTVQEVELGRATVEANSLDLAAVAQRLEAIGLQLLTDRNTRIANEIKALIIDLIRSGNLVGMKTALSDYLATQLGLEYAYLTNLFSTTETLTIEQFWILQRVERVKELLSYNELSINEIAQTLGYSSVAYLTNQFKRVTGLTPALFRSQHSANRNPLDWI